jgi:hypothetical protein
VLWIDSTKEVRVSLNRDTVGFFIDLTDLIGCVNSRSRLELVGLVEERREQLIEGLCGPRYSRSHLYRRGGSYTKTLITGIGGIRFRVKRVISRSDGRVSSPILEALDVRRRRYSRDVRMKLVDFASKMSCGDAGLEFEAATGVRVPRRTIHSLVQEIAPRLLEANQASTRQGLVLGDTTKVRALKSREMNEVHVLLSGSSQVLSLEVNGGWPVFEAEVLVSDDEPGLINAVKAGWRQLCILHALKHLLFTLWGEGMGKRERMDVERAVKQALFTLVDSTKKYGGTGMRRGSGPG